MPEKHKMYVKGGSEWESVNIHLRDKQKLEDKAMEC